jgi:hypothetical protein
MLPILSLFNNDFLLIISQKQQKLRSKQVCTSPPTPPSTHTLVHISTHAHMHVYEHSLTHACTNSHFHSSAHIHSRTLTTQERRADVDQARSKREEETMSQVITNSNNCNRNALMKTPKSIVTRDTLTTPQPSLLAQPHNPHYPYTLIVLKTALPP